MVCQQLEEREQAVETTIVAEDKFKLRRLKAEKLLKSGDEIEQYEGEIEMKEIDNDFKWFKLNADEAVRELSFLKDCARKLEPFRKRGINITIKGVSCIIRSNTTRPP